MATTPKKAAKAPAKSAPKAAPKKSTDAKVTVKMTSPNGGTRNIELSGKANALRALQEAAEKEGIGSLMVWTEKNGVRQEPGHTKLSKSTVSQLASEGLICFGPCGKYGGY